MAKEFINGKSACTKLGCTKEFFHHLVEIGELEAERTETGSWRVSRESVDAVKSKLNTVLKITIKTAERSAVFFFRFCALSSSFMRYIK